MKNDIIPDNFLEADLSEEEIRERRRDPKQEELEARKAETRKRAMARRRERKADTYFGSLYSPSIQLTPLERKYWDGEISEAEYRHRAEYRRRMRDLEAKR
jgi:hypothetical protein